jgi:hypothetical protein
MKTILSLALVSLTVTLAACASSSSPSSSPDPGLASASAQSESAPSLDGTWAFAIDASDVAGPLRDNCAKKAAGDGAKADVCWREIVRESGHEKIRFAKDGSGRQVWTSFAVEGGREEVFVEVPVELTPDGPGHVLAKIAGKAKGTMAGQIEKSTSMRIERVDPRTIALTDPQKGRLVYTRE